ncbi:MAG: hypothetical protein ACR2O4_05050 [Hyphomicrobiaceae bacterium]
MGILAAKQPPGAQEDRPVLHLSGPVLKAALERLIVASDGVGGIEKYCDAVRLKCALFQDILGSDKIGSLPQPDFEEVSAFMATVRRRIAKGIDEVGYSTIRNAIVALLEGSEDTSTTDQRMASFVAAFPAEKSFRWARDLGAEILHAMDPERYPLMIKWVWDAKANTGVLREIWHGDNVDHMVIDAPDTYAMFVVLREELSQFLADNGIFRDMLSYVDLLQAQVYADYINAQGGTYLRTDFATEGDPLEHSRRILGLDGVSSRTGRTKFKTIDGSASVVSDTKYLA